MRRTRKRYYRELNSIKTEVNTDTSSDEDEGNFNNLKEFSLYLQSLLVFIDGGFTLNKKQCRQLFQLESSFPSHLNVVLGTQSKGSLSLDLEASITSEDHPFDSSDEHKKSLLSQHLARIKRKKVNLIIIVFIFKLFM